MSKLLLISNLLLGEKLVRASAPKILNSLGEFGGNPWDALRASRISASKKPSSSILVRRGGLEPPILTEYAPQAYAYTSSATCAKIILLFLLLPLPVLDEPPRAFYCVHLSPLCCEYNTILIGERGLF